MAKFVENRKGMTALRKSGPILQDLERRAKRILEATGYPDLFVTDSQIGKNRARASVRTYGYDASLIERSEHVLERAVDAGGDSA